MEDAKQITDTELLIVRHLKRRLPNDKILKRIVGNYYALHHWHVDEYGIFNCLFDIIEKFDLLPWSQKGKNIRSFFIYRTTFEPKFENMMDSLIYRAKSCIAMSEVAKFPRYPEPAYFKNREKN